MDLKRSYVGKTVWLSGHTGFKGAWLAEWLLALGARVVGYSLAPQGPPSLVETLALAQRLEHQISDINQAEAVKKSLHEARPDFVFHLAAQPLVRRSYEQPVSTFQTNVMGTIHVLEALRTLDHPCAAVLITTDKCYLNRETHQAYREDDPLGGADPYSASKAAAELALAAYRQSYFSSKDALVRVASARAGNVIGGGDWAVDRLVPDVIRALQKGEMVRIRQAQSTRPWQHVLEPLRGYLILAARLAEAKEEEAARLATSFNFGPEVTSNRSVQELVEKILEFWPGKWVNHVEPNPVHEAGLLNLAHEKAFHFFGWHPAWDFTTTVEKTVRWYQMAEENLPALADFTRQQIKDYDDATR